MLPLKHRGFNKKVYVKDQSFDPIYRSVNKEFYLRSRFLPGILMATGFVILVTQVVIPLVYFKTQDEVSSSVSSSVLGVATGFSEFSFSELNEEDEAAVISSLKNGGIEQTQTYPKFFYLSIPRLKIEDALVETNSLSLSPDNNLGHYRGSAVPGDIGNAFIYGHSVLPWFFNPKNYKTIFSTLDHLQVGDTISIKYGDKNLTYKVESEEVMPTAQVDPLAEFKPKYLNESTITLMTCWPAGTKAKRYLVRAVLIS
jgi:LPXTG-site transpeptidase (sortase) family protein